MARLCNIPSSVKLAWICHFKPSMIAVSKDWPMGQTSVKFSTQSCIDWDYQNLEKQFELLKSIF